MKKHYHLIGVNGIGLSGVARILAEMGHKVTGSDPGHSVRIDMLRSLGAEIFHEHKKENVEGADYLVVSSAIPSNNPEVIEAQKRDIPILHRAEMLGHIMKNKTGIAVSGTHGKTTTSSMMATLFELAGLDPTVVIGGELNMFNSNAKLGHSEYMVIEADESDASFLNLDPRWIVVTNVDVDVNLNVAPYADLNFDYHKTLEKVENAFLSFLERLPENGKAILCIDDENLRNMLPRINKPYVTYGLSGEAEVRAEILTMENFGSTSNVFFRDKFLGRLILKTPGRHNVQNALSVVAQGLELGLGFETIASTLLAFNGVKRRFQRIGEVNDVLIVDDYAHNPGKIRALLNGARTGGRGRVVAVFQPHRYTRTKFLFDEFAESFFDADVLVLTEIYSAGEIPIVGVRGESLAKAIESGPKPPGEIHFINRTDEILNFLEISTRPGDIIITCGAGDIYRVAEDLAARLPERWKECLPAV